MKKERHRNLRPWSYPTIAEMPRELVGVYAFWYRRSGRCVYVGMASDQPLKERLRQHWNGSHNETLRLWIQSYGSHLDICYADVERGRIETIERKLIRLWNPEANIQHRR